MLAFVAVHVSVADDAKDSDGRTIEASGGPTSETSP